MPARYDDLLQRDLPLADDEIGRLRSFAARFAELCGELAAHDVPETVQHDDLHMANVYRQGARLLLLDWVPRGDQPPAANRPLFARVRDAYLEPWGRGLSDTLALAIRVGTFAQTFAWARQRDALPNQARRDFDKVFPIVLRRAVAQTLE